MKNLDVYIEASIDFFDNVLASKNNTGKDPTFKIRITSLRANIMTRYNLYDNAFIARNLIASSAYGYISPDKEDLIKLYSYKNKPFQNLKTLLTTTTQNRIVNTCQNCTINEINSFDHILPKEEFPEFAINPKNLFPSCTQCNGYKNVNWRQHGNALFLNLYLDLLPTKQYLFVDIIVGTAYIDTVFSLENRNGLPSSTFQLITSHYEKLHLLERFRINRDNVISEIINTIKAMALKLTEEEIREIVIDKSVRDQQIFGLNYWKSILSIELINSHSFFEFAINL